MSEIGLITTGTAAPDTAKIQNETNSGRAEPSTSRSDDEWLALADMRVRLNIALALEGFRMRQLRELDVGSILETRYTCSDELPLFVQQTQVAWGEFEVLDQHICLRLTSLTS